MKVGYKENKKDIRACVLRFVEGQETPRGVWLWLLVAALAFVGFVWPYMFCNLGPLDAFDEGYQALCVRSYRSCPLGMLTFWQGHLWLQLMGDSVLHLRWLNVVCHQVAMLVGVLFLWRRGVNALTALFFFALLMVGTRIGSTVLYNWDSGSFPYIALWLAAVLLYLEQPRLWKAMAAGVFAALAMLAHVTYVIYLPFFLVLVLIKAPCRQWLRDVVASLAAFAIVTTAVAFMMCGSLTAYIAAFTPENIISGHSTADIQQFIYPLKGWLPRQMFYYAPEVCCFFLALLFVKLLRPTLAAFGWLAFIGFVVGFLTMRQFNVPDFVGSLQGFALPSLWLLLAFIPAYNLTHYPQRIATPRLLLWTVLIAALLLGFGSDHFFQRPSGLIFALPMVWVYVRPLLDGHCRRLWRVFLEMTFIMLVLTTAAQNFYAWKYMKVSLDDIPYHSEMRGSEEQWRYYHALAEAAQRFEAEGRHVTAIGIGHRYQYMYTFQPQPMEGMELQLFHYDEENPAVRQYVEQALREHDAVVFARDANTDYPWTEQALEQAGFTAVPGNPDLEDGINDGYFTLHVKQQ